MITKENFKQKILEFAEKNYKDKLNYLNNNPNKAYEVIKEFPYTNQKINDSELIFKNIIDWFLIERIQPENGKTIAEDFAENTPGIDKDLKACIFKIKNIVYGEFEVLSVDGNKFVIKSLNTNKEYKVMSYNRQPIKSRDIIECRIHEFDNWHRFCGIININPRFNFNFPSFEQIQESISINMLNKLENRIILPQKNLSVLLDFYPINWIDGFCKLLKINAKIKREKIKIIIEKLETELPNILKNLGEEPKEVLRLILVKGGFVKYNLLNRYSDEIDYWWSEGDLPKTIIGSLRANILLFVGKMPINGKMYKVAFIPIEIRDALRNFLQK